MPFGPRLKAIQNLVRTGKAGRVASRDLSPGIKHQSSKAMGRNAKRKKQRKNSETTEVHLVGEQAEVFDEQMTTDREWFEVSQESVYFRPQIDGEFSGYTMLGHEAPSIDIFTDDHQLAPVKKDWTCVIDLGRIMNPGGPPSGWRTRLAVPSPITPQIRQAMLEVALDYAQTLILESRAASKSDYHRLFS